MKYKFYMFFHFGFHFLLFFCDWVRLYLFSSAYTSVIRLLLCICCVQIQSVPDWLHFLDCDTNTFPLSFYDFLNLPQVSLHVWIHPKVYFSSNAETVRYCDSCDKSQEVCVALTEDIPVCNKIQDPLDPTGCGGLCMLDRQVCLRIDTDAFKYVFQK